MGEAVEQERHKNQLYLESLGNSWSSVWVVCLWPKDFKWQRLGMKQRLQTPEEEESSIPKSITDENQENVFIFEKKIKTFN